jgi:hypothetical protein
MLADVIIIDHADGSLIRKLLGPGQPLFEAIVENEKIAALMQSGAGLDQSARGLKRDSINRTPQRTIRATKFGRRRRYTA